MRRLDDGPTDPIIADSLEAIDATLAGDPVDPVHAELAELTLLLASERPKIAPRVVDALDQAVARRFASDQAGMGSPKLSPALRRHWWFWTPAAGLATALIVAVVIVVSGESSPVLRNSATEKASAAGASPGHSSAPLLATAPGSAPRASTRSAQASNAKTGSLAGTAGSPSAAAKSPSVAAPDGLANSALGLANSSFAPALAPAQNGRKTIQGAQLALTAPANRVDTVAQEVFTVVGQVRGIVKSSAVTAPAGPGGYAQFQLSIPSSALPQAMASLSSLHYARVASRTDTTQDVNDQYQADLRVLNDARALRTSLLKQLASATTQAQIDSLTARIHDAEASISSDEAALRGLNRQINYSQVEVTINGGPVPVPIAGSHGGFGIGKAAHDAGRVLTVAAGVALIGAAALIPVALLGALAWWIIAAVRRRRREQALDLV